MEGFMKYTFGMGSGAHTKFHKDSSTQKLIREYTGAHQHGYHINLCLFFQNKESSLKSVVGSMRPQVGQF
jgi:hypothetical protein